MDERVVASSERQQLVGGIGEEDEPTELRLGTLSLSPAISSSCEASVGSKSNHNAKHFQPIATHHNSTRVAFVSERRPRPSRPPAITKDQTIMSPGNANNPTINSTTSNNAANSQGHIDSSKSNSSSFHYHQAPRDAKKTQAALLRLLAEFGSAPPPPKEIELLANIRQQQDDLARLHFKLGSDPDAPAKPASARETMVRLVKSLEQLSTSIEQLHLMTDFRAETGDDSDTETLK